MAFKIISCTPYVRMHTCPKLTRLHRCSPLSFFCSQKFTGLRHWARTSPDPAGVVAKWIRQWPTGPGTAGSGPAGVMSGCRDPSRQPARGNGRMRHLACPWRDLEEDRVPKRNGPTDGSQTKGWNAPDWNAECTASRDGWHMLGAWAWGQR